MLDTIMLILFIIFLVFIIGGFNKQMVEQNKERKRIAEERMNKQKDKQDD